MFSTLCQVLRQWNSDEHKQGVCNTLVEFVKYGIVIYFNFQPRKKCVADNIRVQMFIDNLRDEMLECDVFPPLCDVLCARLWSGKTKQKVCNTLVELAKHGAAVCFNQTTRMDH